MRSGCQVRDDQAPSPRRRIRWTNSERAKKKGVSYLKVLRQGARPGRLPIEGTDTVIREPRLQITFSEPHGSVFISASQTSEPPHSVKEKRKAATVIHTLALDFIRGTPRGTGSI
jgi:hypothetical protein